MFYQKWHLFICLRNVWELIRWQSEAKSIDDQTTPEMGLLSVEVGFHMGCPQVCPPDDQPTNQPLWKGNLLDYFAFQPCSILHVFSQSKRWWRRFSPNGPKRNAVRSFCASFLRTGRSRKPWGWWHLCAGRTSWRLLVTEVFVFFVTCSAAY